MKIALYMTGGYAKILRRTVDFLGEFEMLAICPNWQSYLESKKEPRLSSVDYLYSGFNDSFDQIDVRKFCDEYASINIAEVLFVDKSHFKKMPGDYQLRYACAVGDRLAAIFRETRPDYVFIPIIETIDAMMAYRMALHLGIRPIIYAHSRFAGISYFSDSHLELLPSYMETQNKPQVDKAWGIEFLQRYRSNPSSFDAIPAFPDTEIYSDIEPDTTALQRMLRNISLKRGVEKHNRMISLWINLQVHFQHLFLPVRNFLFGFVEQFHIQPKPVPSVPYDFFPMHCSPEASINVPAPFFIDQIRVVDKILLERDGNRPLVIKEHPAMFGFRENGFYERLKRVPFAHFVHRKTSSHMLIRGAHTVYSVTGTACLEAFLLGVNWVQFGSNYLSDWKSRRERMGLSLDPLDFVRDVLSVSGEFIMYTPGRSPLFDKILFAKKNIENFSAHLKFHIYMDRNGNFANRSEGLRP